MPDEPETQPAPASSVPPPIDVPPASSNDNVPPAQPTGPVIAQRPPRGRPRGRRRVAAARRVEKPTLTPRLSIFIDDNNEIVFDRTRPETIEQLARAIAKPEARKRLGLIDDAGQPTAPRSWAGMTSTLVDSLNAIAVQAAVNTWKLTDDQAQLLLLHRDPKTHQQVIALTGEVLDKYFPGGFGEYDKEISLCILLGGFVVNGVQQIRAQRGDVREFPRAADAATAE